MLRFLRKIRKGFKRACLTTAVVTCWQVGQAANAEISPPPNWGDVVTVQFSGSVSPTVSNISHLFLIYGTGYSSLDFGPWTIKLGDFPAGQTGLFSVKGDAIYQESLPWIVAGLYGDISSGQYTEGVNGVTLGMGYTSVGDPWNWNYEMTEQTAFTYLLNDNPGNAFTFLAEGRPIVNWTEGMDATNSSVLFNFSNASNNGQIQITSEVVPEPVSIILFGTGGMIVVAFRRRDK